MKFTICILVTLFSTVYAQTQNTFVAKSNAYYKVCYGFMRTYEIATKVTTNCFYFNRAPTCRKSETDVPTSEWIIIPNVQCSNDVKFKKVANTIFNQKVNEAIAAAGKK